jgi:hypothetical protein
MSRGPSHRRGARTLRLHSRPLDIPQTLPARPVMHPALIRRSGRSLTRGPIKATRAAQPATRPQAVAAARQVSP